LKHPSDAPQSTFAIPAAVVRGIFDTEARQVLSKIKSKLERVCNNSPQEQVSFERLFPDDNEVSGRMCALDIVTTTSAGLGASAVAKSVRPSGRC
jgi:hypothetical protein